MNRCTICACSCGEEEREEKNRRRRKKKEITLSMRPIDWKGICGQAALNRTRPWQFDDCLCHHHWTCKERRWRRIAADTRMESYPFKSHNQPPPLTLHSVIACRHQW
ncbi:hypothetical protein T4E_7421 [Trichinella pseudospiralis]|uniref:Uncharacterized protein n=1 Tax=Trichinella pseudospiralis TaxID=6337 RepID=A0A0V0XT29_TRIPS|nr:hypothetical protein T4E_7421 [Trichinella pseudospiralis]